MCDMMVAGLPDRPDPHLHLHARQRGQQPQLHDHRRPRGPSRPLAPRRRPEKQEKIAADQPLPRRSSSPTCWRSCKSIKEGDGTLLDNSMIVYGAGISDGDRHNHDDLPILLAGKGGGHASRPAATSATRTHAAEQPVPLDAGPHGRPRRDPRRQHRPAYHAGVTRAPMLTYALNPPEIIAISGGLSSAWYNPQVAASNPTELRDEVDRVNGDCD